MCCVNVDHLHDGTGMMVSMVVASRSLVFDDVFPIVEHHQKCTNPLDEQAFFSNPLGQTYADQVGVSLVGYDHVHACDLVVWTYLGNTVATLYTSVTLEDTGIYHKLYDIYEYLSYLLLTALLSDQDK